jgi:predicted AlkP superfamily phosphohydrolase/phosphomutase
VPPNYPPRRFPGVSVGCFLTPNTSTCDYTYPAKAKAEIEELIGEYPVDVAGFRTEDKLWLKQKIWEMTDKHFQVVRHFLKTVDWQYFQFLEIGLDRIHHGFWKYFDPQHRQYVAGHPLASVIPDYYRYLDKQIGSVLELVDSKTAVLIVSDHGAQRLEGGFCVNEWLQREGLLVLKHEISQPVRFSPDLVDWSRTRAWSEGGYYARVFFNIQGREPQGVVPAADYEAFAAEMEERFVNLLDDRGQPMGSIVFRPYRLYRRVERVAPDLIVHFGALYWRSIGGLGYENLYQQENDTGPDDCNHAQQGVLIMAVPGEAPRGQLEQLHLLDVAPTILELMGLPIPHTMQGRSILHREATV